MPISRRDLLTGKSMPARLHVSSAVVTALPQKLEAVATELGRMPGVEVHGHNATRLVVVLEGTSAGQLGEKLATIALMEGVVSANMVFEQSEELAHDTGGHHTA